MIDDIGYNVYEIEGDVDTFREVQMMVMTEAEAFQIANTQLPPGTPWLITREVIIAKGEAGGSFGRPQKTT